MDHFNVRILGGPINDGAGMATSEAARVSALSILLDRGYGKVSQPIEHSADEGSLHGLHKIVR
jgi:hypothetical protein